MPPNKKESKRGSALISALFIMTLIAIAEHTTAMGHLSNTIKHQQRRALFGITSRDILGNGLSEINDQSQ